jgi:hypothetical protein
MRSRDKSASILVAPAAKYSAIPRPVPWAAPVNMTIVILDSFSEGGVRLGG